MVRIDPNKPLPEHTKLRYEECYAKVFLEYFYPNEFCNLIIQDKPDLYDCKNDIGIEVVEAEEQRKKEAVKLWYTMPYVSEQEKVKNKDRMKQLGEEYMGGFQVWSTISYDKDIDSKPFKVLYAVLNRKLQKLKTGNYKLCKSYELFIYSELMIRKVWHEIMLARLIDISTKYSLKYEQIHIATQDSLCLYNIQENTFKFCDITEKQKELAFQARKLVERGEDE